MPVGGGHKMQPFFLSHVWSVKAVGKHAVGITLWEFVVMGYSKL